MVNKLRGQSRFTCFEMGQAYGEDGWWEIGEKGNEDVGEWT